MGAVYDVCCVFDRVPCGGAHAHPKPLATMPWQQLRVECLTFLNGPRPNAVRRARGLTQCVTYIFPNWPDATWNQTRSAARRTRQMQTVHRRSVNQHPILCGIHPCAHALTHIHKQSTHPRVQVDHRNARGDADVFVGLLGNYIVGPTVQSSVG